MNQALSAAIALIAGGGGFAVSCRTAAQIL
jgi:hypothetical protein